MPGSEDRAHQDAPPPVIPQTPTVVYQNQSQTVWWVIAVCLAVIATALVVRSDRDGGLLDRAMAQSTSAGAHGVFAFSGQMTKNSYGVYMVDVDTGTIWCYEYESNKPLLKLVAARTWLQDRYLENFSTSPGPKEIKQALEDQRAAALQAAGP